MLRALARDACAAQPSFPQLACLAHQPAADHPPSAVATDDAAQVAAGLGAAWVVGRIFYTLGYSTGDPQGRLPGGAASGLVFLGLLLSTLVVGLRTALP